MTKDQRTRFVASCIEGCQETPNISALDKKACLGVCGCLADKGEAMMTPADFDEADKAAANNKSTPKMDALSKFLPPAVGRRSDARPTLVYGAF